MTDLETSLADQQARLAELHAAFAKKLDNAAALHKANCAERDSELRIREKVAADKLKAAAELAEAIEERERILTEREKRHEEKIAHLSARADAIIREMNEADAARAKAARVGS